MTELLLILVVIFVAYVLFGTQKEPQNTVHTPIISAKPDNPAPVAAVKSLMSQTSSKTKKEAAPANRAVIYTAKTPESATTINSKTATSKKSKSTELPQISAKPGLKDPNTGEIVTNYSNYRFTKRWIKEALVAEGLLDKVYKNDELNADVETKIKNAIVKLESIKKYRV